jgi:hypothetical protein
MTESIVTRRDMIGGVAAGVGLVAVCGNIVGEGVHPAKAATLADSMPKLAVTMLSFAGPEGKFASAVVGQIFSALIPSPSSRSTEEVVLMAVERLENFIKAQFDDVEVRNALHHVSTTYDWFKITYARAKTDKEQVNRTSASVMGQIDDALGPNSFLDLGINMLSDERYRYLGVNTLCMAIGLKLTLWKIQMLVNNDRSSLPAIMDQISAYIDTIGKARQDAEAYAFRDLQKLGPTITEEDRRKFIARRDQLVQLLYQGEDRSGEARALLNRALVNYSSWQT